MQKIDVQELKSKEISEGSMLDLLAEKVNEIIDARAKSSEDQSILIERVAKLEGELDAKEKRLKTTEAALMRTITNLEKHRHDDLGIACVPLAS